MGRRVAPLVFFAVCGLLLSDGFDCVENRAVLLIPARDGRLPVFAQLFLADQQGFVTDGQTARELAQVCQDFGQLAGGF